MLWKTSTDSITMLVSAGSGGVHDYAATVGHRLSQTEIASITPGNRDVLMDCEGRHVVLQYSGYGFQKRGTPLWLLPRLREVQKVALSVGVYFHELYADGPPWRSAFWLSWWQREIVKSLAGISDYWLTNRTDSARWILRHSGERPHAVLPVPSNVGELPLQLDGRRHEAVVFGSAAVRRQLYARHGSALLRWAEAGGLLVHDVGAPLRDAALQPLLNHRCMRNHGILPAEAVSALMRDARFGLIDYAAAEAAKSSVFAAYCAHALAPVLLSASPDCADGLQAGRHYLGAMPEGAIDPAQVEAIGRAAWLWYQPHRAARHADALRALIHHPGELGESTAPEAMA